MTTYTIPAELLQELISNCMASIAEDGISDARRVYRTELHHRANLAMRNLQPNTQEPVAYVSRIAENGRPDIGWLNAEGLGRGSQLYTHPAPQQTQWQDLTVLEQAEATSKFGHVSSTDMIGIADAISAKLQEKNGHLHPAPQAKPLTDEQIKEIMLANGFNIKDGLTDLKPYVYAAARAIEAAHGVKP